jgi:hypothetical protein
MQSKETPGIVEYRDFKHFNRTNIFLELESLSNLNLDSICNPASNGKSRTHFLILLKHAHLRKVEGEANACHE